MRTGCSTHRGDAADCAQATGTGQQTPSAAAAALAAGFRALADAVEAAPELLSVAAESMAEDFVAARAPPDEGQVCGLVVNPNPDPDPDPNPDPNPPRTSWPRALPDRDQK